MATHSQLWAIVLAGGDGKRLAPLTKALYGKPIPKQFAVITGEGTLLADTLHRALPLVPSGRTIVVATKGQEAYANADVAAFPGARVVVQTQNRNTGAGVLVGLSHVMARDPHARVLVLPADHYVRDTAGFVSAMAQTADACHAADVALTLLGVVPGHDEVEYGWVVPGGPLSAPAVGSGPGLRSVARFTEKPTLALARELRGAGALWNTFVFAGLASRCWALCEQHLGPVMRRFERYRAAVGTANEEAAMGELFAGLPSLNFSDLVLAKAALQLAVVTCPEVGWSDIGTPRRVFEALDQSPASDRLLARLGPLAVQQLKVG